MGIQVIIFTKTRNCNNKGYTNNILNKQLTEYTKQRDKNNNKNILKNNITYAIIFLNSI